jgi:hypothetical protein
MSRKRTPEELRAYVLQAAPRAVETFTIISKNKATSALIDLVTLGYAFELALALLVAREDLTDDDRALTAAVLEAAQADAHKLADEWRASKAARGNTPPDPFSVN